MRIRIVVPGVYDNVLHELRTGTTWIRYTSQRSLLSQKFWLRSSEVILFFGWILQYCLRYAWLRLLLNVVTSWLSLQIIATAQVLCKTQNVRTAPEKPTNVPETIRCYVLLTKPWGQRLSTSGDVPCNHLDFYYFIESDTCYGRYCGRCFPHQLLPHPSVDVTTAVTISHLLDDASGGWRQMMGLRWHTWRGWVNGLTRYQAVEQNHSLRLRH